MSRNVIILGAGASAEAGAPLMNSFLERAEDLLRQDKVGVDRPWFDLVLKGRSALLQTHSKSLSIDVYNMEAVFSAFEMGNMLGRLAELSEEDIRGLPNAYKRVIAKTLEQSMVFPVNGSQVLSPRPYDAFVGLIRHLNKVTKANTSVVSFNYDLALDYALSWNNEQIDYGLDPAANFPERIKVLKLHGSLNWMECQKCRTACAWHIPDFLDKYRISPYQGQSEHHFTLSSHLDQFRHCDSAYSGVQPILVPPTWNKSSYHIGIENVWRQAAKELSEAENIFVIGYSLPPTDVFFHYLFSIGVTSKNILRRFWVFDPNPEVQERYKKLLSEPARSRFQFVGIPFTGAIHHLHSAMKG